tara:strand:- start:167 stop:1120 length:954 start_codon:yes stop_codon:yes gene_type:complete
MFEFIIYDKTLGFTLDKTKSNPTIDKITPGGALEKILIEHCGNVSSGSIIKYIGTQDVENYNYDQIYDYIKSYIERPIKITFLQEKDIIRQSYVTTQSAFKNASISNCNYNYISEKEMNHISEQATQTGLRELVSAHKRKKLEYISDSEEDSSDQEEYISIHKYDKLQEKTRMLELDILNLKIENEDYHKNTNKILDPIKNINESLCHIESLIDRYSEVLSYTKFLNIGSDTMNELYEKYNKDFIYIVTECENLLVNIKYNQLKNCIKYMLHNKKKKMNNINIKFTIKVKFKKIYELFIIVILLYFTYYIMNNLINF